MLWLTAVTIVTVLLSVGPAWMVSGSMGLAAVALAAVACLVPGILLFALLAVLSASDSQAWAVLAGGGLRVIFAGGAALLAIKGADWPMVPVLCWVGLFYAVTLVLEVWMLLAPSVMASQKSA